MKIIQLRDYGRRTRVHAQQVHDHIAKALKASSRVRLDFADVDSIGATFLDRSLGALVARHGATVLRSIVLAHCTTSVEASIIKALRQAAPLRGLLNFSGAKTLPKTIDEFLLEVALVMPTERSTSASATHYLGSGDRHNFTL